MYLGLTVEARGETAKLFKLEPGDKVEYLGHLPGGNVKIKHANGETDIAHPTCFKELR